MSLSNIVGNTRGYFLILLLNYIHGYAIIIQNSSRTTHAEVRKEEYWVLGVFLLQNCPLLNI